MADKDAAIRANDSRNEPSVGDDDRVGYNPQQQQPADHQPPRTPLVSALSATVSSILHPFQLQNMLPGFLTATSTATSTAIVAAEASAGTESHPGPPRPDKPAELLNAAAVGDADAAEDNVPPPASDNPPRKAPVASKRSSKNAKGPKRHQGKGKSRTATATSSSQDAPGSPSTTPANAASQPLSPPRQPPRRSSSTLSKSKARKVQLIPVDDPEPLRIVNPLVDLPADPHPLHVRDVWNLVDGAWFAPEDTHTIAYAARVLGYRGVPTTVPPHLTITPVRFVRTSSLDSYPHDPAYSVPRPGRPPWNFSDQDDAEGEARDVLQRGVDRDGRFDGRPEWDPFYATLLEVVGGGTSRADGDEAEGHPDNCFVTTAVDVSAAQLSKIISVVLLPTNAEKAVPAVSYSSSPASSSPLQSTVDLAVKLGILADGYRAYFMVHSESSVDANEGAPGGDESRSDGESKHLPNAASDESPCGIVLHRASDQGEEPLAWASYTFRWYPATSPSSSASAPSPSRYELVVEILNLRTRTANLLESTLVEHQDELYFVVLVACVLEHARLNSVHYGLAPPAACLQTCFRMVTEGRRRKLVCDLHKCSGRYAFLKFREITAMSPSSSLTPADDMPVVARQRWLAQLPMVAELKRKPAISAATSGLSGCLHSANNALSVNPDKASSVANREEPPPLVVVSSPVAGAETTPSAAPARKQSKKRSETGPATKFSSGPASSLSGLVSVRVRLLPDGCVVVPATSNGSAGVAGGVVTVGADSRASRILAAGDTDPVQVQLLREFQVRDPEPDDSEILEELKVLQGKLRSVETSLHGKTHELMGCVIDARLTYERQSQARKMNREILEQYQRNLDRRKQLDLAWRKQLEQDMDAVCDVCNDGEVTPDNQILFCEACNVAVHQMCYGIDKIPDGDYYCIACRYLGRDQARVNQNGGSVPSTAPKPMPTPLPISCELCPYKQGAYIRTDFRKGSDSDPPFGKWVHAVCAKWLGLDYVTAPDLLEDVTDWKKSFRRNRIKCHLCEGERGCMNKCSFDGCDKWVHVTCARSVGTCEVIHGEDVRGAVSVNPWTLKCPDHSDVKQEEIPKGAASIKSLVQLAKEFPPEPVPPPEVMEWKPFNTATGTERALLLHDKSYERSLLTELTTKNLFGVRCDVCEQEIDVKLRLRCQACDVVFCRDCSLGDVDGSECGGSFKCARCIYISTKEKAGEECETPSCLACYHKSGWLRKGIANAYTKKGTLSSRKFGDLRSTYFGRQLWVHTLCTFWNPKLVLSVDTGVVDSSNVMTVNGRGLIHPSSQCFLCGNTGGLKVKCSHDGCAYLIGGKRTEAVFHVTCARLAGLEVNTVDDGSSMKFCVKCYRHGGNEYNLRAKLEDMLEIEKRRSGKQLAKSEAPMKFSHASRLLHSAIGILRVLGWAWQWAEQWVDYNSSWEPLLEPGEKEEEMTKEELKIVDSTRESRCAAARACRLVAFGAALRNRNFDKEEDFDREAFNRALLSILRTESLVGPLLDHEVEFYRHWLALAYWSKSRHLGFGDDKIEVRASNSFCRNLRDNSPKFELGTRPLPGMMQVVDFDEADNFMLSEVISDDMLDSLKQLSYISSPPKSSPMPASGRPRRSQPPQNGIVADAGRLCSPVDQVPVIENDTSMLHEESSAVDHISGSKDPVVDSVEISGDPSSYEDSTEKKRKRGISSARGDQATSSTLVLSHRRPEWQRAGREKVPSTHFHSIQGVPLSDSRPTSAARSARRQPQGQSPGPNAQDHREPNAQENLSGREKRRRSPPKRFSMENVAQGSEPVDTSTPIRREGTAALPSSYDKESVRRARRPPYLDQESSSDANPNLDAAVDATSRPVAVTKRGRGRPPKLESAAGLVFVVSASTGGGASNETTAASPAKKRRGRSSKKLTVVDDLDDQARVQHDPPCPKESDETQRSPTPRMRARRELDVMPVEVEASNPQQNRNERATRRRRQPHSDAAQGGVIGQADEKLRPHVSLPATLSEVQAEEVAVSSSAPLPSSGTSSSSLLRSASSLTGSANLSMAIHAHHQAPSLNRNEAGKSKDPPISGTSQASLISLQQPPQAIGSDFVGDPEQLVEENKNVEIPTDGENASAAASVGSA